MKSSSVVSKKLITTNITSQGVIISLKRSKQVD